MISITAKGVQMKTPKLPQLAKPGFQCFHFQPMYSFSLPKHKEMTMPALYGI